ncbi:MAG: pyruvate dehydrogenase complex E1 component subunit beta [Candidatus Cyclonatronum sp.]|uniref:pyruvate dehydrogenase complex E1 component subunit beta n=1 Tax=Cyclonatronum sp. TaxID=3024185 RepID=UPI0025BA32BB|nr:pyruvate dehydrogenase complex E1 component subunit beta [Cyclonatronum sp.]MCC5933158.1 pyruvate dehydrogenase complex E1 component subunit beta [Balneolales bacterium]MCH8485546.1 pyruvate dehydrogenase complex E1 component subunit beta [Cyclonatronum sp.]
MSVKQFRDAIREAMVEEMRRDESIIIMGEEVAEYDGAYKVTQGMLEEFGLRRVIDTPISELGFSGIGAGAAMNGLRPIIEFMTFNFAVVGIDQILNNAAKIRYMSGGQVKFPMVFRGPNASAGQLGATHSVAYESLYAHIPGLKVMYPSEPYDAKGMLKTAIRDDDPVIFLESEQMYAMKQEVPDEEYLIPFGVGKIKREGDDVTIVAHGKMYHIAQQAAKELAKDGIEAEVIDPRCMKPFDFKMVIESIKKTNRCVIVDESHPFAGMAAEIGFVIQRDAFDYLDAPVQRVTIPDVPAPFAKNLFDLWLPGPKQVIDAVKAVTYKN